MATRNGRRISQRHSLVGKPEMADKLFRVSVCSVSPYIDYVVKNGSIHVTGVMGDLWTALEERLGFRSEYSAETFSDGITNFRNGSRDVLLYPFVHAPWGPEDELNFPVMDIWYDVYLGNTPEINSSKAFIKCWSTDLWLYTIVLTIMVLVILYTMLLLASKFTNVEDFTVPCYQMTDSLVQLHFFANKHNLSNNWRLRVYPHQRRQTKNERSMGCCFMAVVAALLSQDICLRTEVTSVRILIFFFLCFGMLMYTAYSGLLISQLTLGHGALPFGNLDEILEMKQPYSLCVRSNSYPYLHLMGHPTNDHQKKWAKILNGELCPENKESSDWSDTICASKTAFLEIPAFINPKIKNAHCKVTKFNEKYYRMSFFLMVNSGGFDANVKTDILRELLRYRETGILSRFKRTWISEDKPLKLNTVPMQISYQQVSGVFLAYLLCIGFSCVIFLFELLAFRLSNLIQYFSHLFSHSRLTNLLHTSK